MCWILHDDIYNNWYTSWTEHFASANLRWFFPPVISWPCSSLYNLLESIQLSVSSRRRQRRTNERKKNSKSDKLQRLKCMMKEMYGAKLWTLNMCLFSHIFYYTLYSSMSPLLFDFYLCCVFLFCFVLLVLGVRQPILFVLAIVSKAWCYHQSIVYGMQYTQTNVILIRRHAWNLSSRTISCAGLGGTRQRSTVKVSFAVFSRAWLVFDDYFSDHRLFPLLELFSYPKRFWSNHVCVSACATSIR